MCDANDLRLKYIYLDTSHLQKWQQEKLESHELNILDEMSNSDEYIFVLSRSHLIDISGRDDNENIIKLAKHIDRLKTTWFSPEKTLHQEFKSAIKSYSSKTTVPIHPWADDFVDIITLESCSALQVTQSYRGAPVEQILRDLARYKIEASTDLLSEDRIKHWGSINSELICELNKTNKSHVKAIKENFLRVLKDVVESSAELTSMINEAVINKKVVSEQSKQFIIVDTPLVEFTNWLNNNPLLVPSLYIPYVVQHEMFRQMFRDKLKNFKHSDFQDLDHISAIPYIDYISLDRRFFSHASQAFHSNEKIPKIYQHKLIKKINQFQDS